MRFYTDTQFQKLKRRPPYPFVVLTWDSWDDYGYKTTFDARVYLSVTEAIDLGVVKILEFSQEGGRTKLPAQPFNELGDEYCSLGHGLDYYEAVHRLGRELRTSYLRAVGDVAWSEERLARFEDLEGFKVSLLRFSGAERLIEDAAKFLRQENRRRLRKRTSVVFTFKTSIGRDGPSLVGKFSFAREKRLPNRVNALIGYNGTGKTRLLSNLAIVASEYGYDSKRQRLEHTFGRFVGAKPPFARVVVVSYSAFDNFIIPDAEEAERVGYIYCGLRVKIHPIDKEPEEPIYGLKDPEAIDKDFVGALQRIHELKRVERLQNAIRPLLDDGSFIKIGLAGLFTGYSQDWFLRFFRSLSSGHKIVVKILIELVAYLDGEKPTLVLIDEPETHLHPPLVAAFLRAVRVLLDDLNGFAIVATHSPVVLQELPSRYVHVLRRGDKKAAMSEPEIETFGESIGNITQEVFNLDDGSTDWHETLRELSRHYTLEEIEELFGRRLGFAARSYIASERLEDGE